jgi:hypothetical protein
MSPRKGFLMNRILFGGKALCLQSIGMCFVRASGQGRAGQDLSDCLTHLREANRHTFLIRKVGKHGLEDLVAYIALSPLLCGRLGCVGGQIYACPLSGEAQVAE